MKEKYVVEAFRGHWLIFGDSGVTVDICDSEGSVAEVIPRVNAESLIRERNALLYALIAAIGDDAGSSDRLELASEAFRDARTAGNPC